MKTNEYRQTYSLYLIIVVVLFILSLIIQKGEDVLWINGHHSFWLDSVMVLVTQTGDGLIFIPVVIILLFVRFQYALVALLAGVAHGIIVVISKQFIFHGALRPKSVLDHDLLYFVPGIKVHAINTFPFRPYSHSFCLALFLALLINKRVFSIAALIFALLVGYSRIYLLQHFLVDVAAGALVGSATVFILWQALCTGPGRPWMSLKLTFNNRKALKRLPANSSLK